MNNPVFGDKTSRPNDVFAIVRIGWSQIFDFSPQTVFAVGAITPDMTRLNSKLTSAVCSVPLIEHYVFTSEYELPFSFLANLTLLKMNAPITKMTMRNGTAAFSNMFWISFQLTGW
jgi:hypothetical protein